MRVVIAGGREMEIGDTFAAIGYTCFDITTVISGNAIGTDRHGRLWGVLNGVPVALFPVTPAEWKRYGKAAGPRRNRTMGEIMDALIAVWDGYSRGTADMISVAEAKGVPCELYGPRPTDADIEYDCESSEWHDGISD